MICLLYTLKGNVKVQQMLLKNKIRYEYDTNNLRNLLQQLQKMDIEPMLSILDIDYNVSNY